MWHVLVAERELELVLFDSPKIIYIRLDSVLYAISVENMQFLYHRRR